MKYFTNRRMLTFLFFLVFCIIVSGCAKHYHLDASTDSYGFFSGLLHGILLPISLIVNLVSWICSLIDISFLKEYEIIGRPNSGFLYYTGFVIGMLMEGSIIR